MSDQLPVDPDHPPWAAPAAAARTEYRIHLERLDATLVDLADRIADAIAPANAALLAGDRSAAIEARRRDHDVRRRCRSLEDECFVLIAREAPVAADLREVVAIVRAVTDVERSSKLLVHIVETLDGSYPPGMPESARTALERLGGSTRRIFRAGVRAWRDRDGLAVNELEELERGLPRRGRRGAGPAGPVLRAAGRSRRGPGQPHLVGRHR